MWGAVDPTLKGTLTGFLSGVTATWTRRQGENVGTYPITATLNASPTTLANYTITTNTALFTINPAPATLTFPAQGSQLQGSTATFTWNNGGATQQYELWVGTTGVGSRNLYGYGIRTSNLAATVTNLPTTGVLVYVRLTTYINGAPQSYDYTFVAQGTPSPSALTSPTPNSQLTSTTATFAWTPGTGVTRNELRIGTNGVGSSNIYGYGIAQTGGTVTVSGLPATGVTLYVQLLSVINGVSQANNYTFTAQGTPGPSVLTSPALNSHLTSTTATFVWSTGTGVTRNELRIGTNGAGSSNVYGYGIAQTGGTVTVSGLPATGVTLYVQLISVINGVSQSNNYTFTAFGTAAPSVLTSPINNSVFGSTSVTFTWDPGTGVTRNELRIGTTGPGSWNVYGYGIGQTGGTVTVNSLPTGGVKLYVQLVSVINGVGQSNNYTFTSK